MTPQRRFTLAVIVTVLVVAYVLVPWVADLLEGLATYNPTAHEPKDVLRGERVRGPVDPGAWTPQSLVKTGLFVLLAVVWFMATSGGRPR